MIPKYHKVTIVDYKAFVMFEKGLERMGVVLYQFGYQITLTHFKARYLKLELEEDPFTDYLDDQNILIMTKVPFDDSLDPSPYPDA